ncbi:MAG: superoxide dismutase [Ni] [Calditrichia bacterium]
MRHAGKYMAYFMVIVFSLMGVQGLLAHCQIPCGIYGDDMRFKMIEEHIATIEKSMKQITELSRENRVNYNQLVRWITNKDDHANYIQEIVDKYFLTQRVKPVDPQNKEEYQGYLQKLELLHQMLFYAMKTKQTTDLAHVEKLRELLSKFHQAYFGAEESKHLEEHHR